MNYFDEIFNRIKEKLNINSDKEMYEYMGIIQGTFTNWRRRDKIPYEKINSICVKENLDLNYIINGKEKEINYKDENIKMINELDDEKSEIYYHKLKANTLESL